MIKTKIIRRRGQTQFRNTTEALNVTFVNKIQKAVNAAIVTGLLGKVPEKVTLSDLARVSAKQWMALPGIGARTVVEMHKHLHDYGVVGPYGEAARY